MACQICDPVGSQGQGCFFCRKDYLNAPGAKSTESTPSVPTAKESAETADSATTESQSSGTSHPSSPYLDILADLLFVLHGDDDLVDVTPLLQIAAMAIELELAERLLDESYLDAGPRTATFAN